jgi:hypothetical protein
MQALEVVVALVFVDLSVHVNNAGLMIAGAGALVALAVTAQGPLGIFRICSQRIHLLLLVIAAAAVAVAPIVPVLRPDIEGIIVIEFGAVGLIRLATLTLATEYRRTGAAPRTGFASRTGFATGRRRGATVIDTTATVVDGSPPVPPREAPRPDNGGRAAGNRPETTTGAAARWVGRTTGAAATSGKKMAAKYRPEAEAQVKKTIRGAGRLAGRVTSTPEPPEDPTA